MPPGSTLKALGVVLAKGKHPIEYCSGSVNNGKLGGGTNDFYFVWCRANCADIINKVFAYQAGGQLQLPGLWLSNNEVGGGFELGAINGGFYDADYDSLGHYLQVPHTSIPCGDLWMKGTSDTPYVWVTNYTTTRRQRWTFAMNETGSVVYISRMVPTSSGQFYKWADPNKLQTFDFARSYVGCMMKEGRSQSQGLSRVVNHMGDANARSLIAWSVPVNGKRHFFLVALKHETWDGVAAFFSPQGRLAQEMGKTFGVPNLQIEGIIWLDGGQSTRA